MSIANPFDFLVDLEKRTLTGGAGLPALDQVEEEWVGIGFRVGDSKLIASMSEVKEVLDLPEFTRVPGVKSWVVGVANVRGNLLPIMDMKGFLLGEDTKQRQKGKVIVIDYKGFDTGLVVEEIFGMRHFREADATAEIPEVHDSIKPFIERTFHHEDEYWPVFGFTQMAQDDRFLHASL